MHIVLIVVLGTCCIINIVFIVRVFRNSDKWEQRN